MVTLKNFRFYRMNMLNYIVEERITSLHDVTGKPKTEWKQRGYFGDIYECVRHIMKHDVHEGNEEGKGSITEYLGNLTENLEEIKKYLKEDLKEEVKSEMRENIEKELREELKAELKEKAKEEKKNVA